MIKGRSDNVRVYDDQPHTIDVVRKIIRDQPSKDEGDAFFAMDLGYLVEILEQWKRLLPRVEPFYAMKVNPDPVLLGMMTQLKLGFDCASMNEIKTILSMGNPPSSIVYANTRKQPSHLRYAASAGVNLTTFGDKDELYKVKECAPDMGLILRLSTLGFTCSDKMTKKFGCGLDETMGLLETAKELNLNVKGVSFHVGSRCADTGVFTRAIRESKRVFTEAAELGFEMTILDIGGALPCKTTSDYCPHDPALSFQKFASVINEALADTFPEGCGVRVIAEPGACLSMPSTVLVASIIGTRDNRDKPDLTDDDASLEYFINDGLYSSMNIYREYPGLLPYVEPVSKEYAGATRYKCKLWGQSCDFDLLSGNSQLPAMKTGDWLYITDKGSYSSIYCTGFNGFKPPRLHQYISKSMIRRFDEMVESLGPKTENGAIFSE